MMNDLSILERDNIKVSAPMPRVPGPPAHNLSHGEATATYETWREANRPTNLLKTPDYSQFQVSKPAAAR